jgi:quercetin dioxygenase-like cupin family protein
MSEFKNRVLTLGRAGHAVRLTAAAALVAACVSGTAQATPPSGVIFPDTAILARGYFADATDVKFKVTTAKGQDVINAPNAGDTIVQRIVIGPNGNFGWHSHPGPVVVVVVSGELTFYDGDDPTCTPRPYFQGQVFIDKGQGHVHYARNLGSTNLVLYATYFDVPANVLSPRIDAPDPGNCTF